MKVVDSAITVTLQASKARFLVNLCWLLFFCVFFFLNPLYSSQWDRIIISQKVKELPGKREFSRCIFYTARGCDNHMTTFQRDFPTRKYLISYCPKEGNILWEACAFYNWQPWEYAGRICLKCLTETSVAWPAKWIFNIFSALGEVHSLGKFRNRMRSCTRKPGVTYQVWGI